jgi:hypothetical protein
MALPVEDVIYRPLFSSNKMRLMITLPGIAWHQSFQRLFGKKLQNPLFNGNMTR